jgi:glutathione-specific gamma-glutamylcyclotransferase
MTARREMALTAALVARIHRSVADPGPAEGFVPLVDDDFDAIAAELLASPHAGGDLWLFAYGSLLWKPACEVDGQEPALVRGWHRAFCLRLRRYRGTPDCPGLMMALDRGGACRGVAQRLPAAQARESLGRLLRRELSVRPASLQPRWVMAEVEGRQRPALAFTMNRAAPTYVAGLSIEETASALAKACGHWGTGAEYLLNTVQHLEALGIHDRFLWRLQQRVADKIRSAES